MIRGDHVRHLCQSHQDTMELQSLMMGRAQGHKRRLKFTIAEVMLQQGSDNRGSPMRICMSHGSY